MTLTALFIGGLLPWQSPSLFGAHGHPPDDPERITATIAYEWPLPHWTVIGDELPKDAVEQLHLDRYCTDRLLSTGQLPYASLVPGRNPPDFVATTADGATLGVDATQLTASGRFAAQAEFERIRRAVLAEPRVDFAHLRGHMLYLWFRTGTEFGLPHRGHQAVQQVVSALRTYVPDTSWTEMPPVAEGMPDQLGVTDMQTTDSGCTFYAAELRAAVPGTTFFARTGFEMALAYQTEHAADAAWIELARLVKRHDKPEIQHLVVTVGGPNRRGLAYPSEGLLLDMALATGAPSLSPEHIQSVVLHSWSDGRVIEVHPGPGGATPPLYPGGYSVSNLSLLQPPEVQATVVPPA